jgi:hypothetical protein
VTPSFAVVLGANDKSYLNYSSSGRSTGRWRKGAYGHFSFWARSSVNREIVIRFVRNFGTGGSNNNGHTSEVLVTKSVQLTTGWKKYQVDCRFPAFSQPTALMRPLKLEFTFRAGPRTRRPSSPRMV